MTQNELRAERKKFAINLLGGRCSACGKTEDLQFDHINPKTKTKHISVLLNGKIEKLEEELKKCQLLCYSCHQIKTAKERSRGLRHGTINAYINHKCRCDECRDFYSAYRKNYYKEHGWYVRRENYINHGTQYAYYKHKCRCQKCVDAVKEARKNSVRLTKERREKEKV